MKQRNGETNGYGIQGDSPRTASKANRDKWRMTPKYICKEFVEGMYSFPDVGLIAVRPEHYVTNKVR